MVVGASAGGVEALRSLAAGLDPGLPASLFVVLHVLATGTSVLPGILDRSGPLQAKHAVDGDHIEHGRIYVCPPDCHLLLERGMIRLSRGPRENGHRPAIDPLFRSAARVYRERVVGVLLSGVLDDGSAGLQMVKLGGGATVVQDPTDALYPAMPQNAIEHVGPEHILPVAQIPDLLARLAVSPPDAKRATLAPIEPMTGDEGSVQPQPGEPSGFTCPDCGGALWEADEAGLLRYRCRVGHEFAVESLLASQRESVESALWASLRALEERAALYRRLAIRAARGRPTHPSRFQRRAEEADDHAQVLRQILENLEAPPELAVDETGVARA